MEGLKIKGRLSKIRKVGDVKLIALKGNLYRKFKKVQSQISVSIYTWLPYIIAKFLTVIIVKMRLWLNFGYT